MRPLSLCFGLAALAIGQGSGAQESAKPAQGTSASAPAAAKAEAPATARAEDTKALAALIASFTRAFNAGDAAAAAATYTEDALVVDEDGERTEGRAAIRDRLAASFADSPGDTITVAVDSLRFLGAETALEEGRTTITPAGKGVAPESSRFTVVYVKQGGRWLQAAVRDEAEDDLGPHDRLKELEWLLGEWVNESQDAFVTTTCKWGAGGNFLDREFNMKTRGRPVLSGTQRIGWDPLKKQFKTWIFDSEGGHGEGYFTHEGDRWIVKVEGVGREGLPISATNIITRVGKDRLGWQSIDRTVGGTAVEGIDEFIVVRKPPEVGK